MTMEQNPTKPKMRWFQYRLKSLFVLTLIVGIGTYWYDWRQHRPPVQEYDSEPHRMAFERFAEDLVEPESCIRIHFGTIQTANEPKPV